MTPMRTLPRLALAAATLAAPAAAQQQPKLPPVRKLETILARSDEPMTSISAAVPLPDGKVLVNDVLQRRVIMFDSTLKQVTVVADSTSATANAYGARGGGLIGYGGDSALFIDPASLSMMVINGRGELTTVRAVPRAQEINLFSGANGRPGFDPQGRLVYRGQNRPGFGGQGGGRGGQGGGRDGARAGGEAQPRQRGQGGQGGQGGGFGGGPGGFTFQMPTLPDSAPIFRVDLATRSLDTLGSLRINRPDVKVTQGADGRPNVQTTLNPMPMIDEWALLSDGTIALVRGHDFHVDWRAPDGTVTAGPKLPFDWQRMSDDDKQFVLDSTRTAIEKQREEAQRMMNAAGGPAAFIQGGGGERLMAGALGGGGPVIIAGGGPGGGPGGGGAPPQRQQGGNGGNGGGQGGGPGGPGGGFQVPAVNLIPATEMPDYRPPFAGAAALGDLDGHLWVRTTAPTDNGGALYYVISKDNEVIDRVQVPQGRLIAGFGKGGIVYLGFRDTEGKGRLEIARWK